MESDRHNTGEQPGHHRASLPVCTLPEALQARLEKADGHLNAASRTLWHETERGFWSATQAKARLAEVWLWLHGEPVEPLPLGHSLKRPAVQRCLEVWSRSDLPEPIANALSEVAAAEQAIRLVPFPCLATPLSDASRQALNEGIARQGRYEAALRELLRAIEDVLAERYLSLSPGDWVRLHDGAVGRFTARHGLTAYFFMPSTAASDPAAAVRGYCAWHARIERIDTPQYPPICAPAYYWLFHAYEGLYRLRRFIAEPDLFGVANIGNTLLATLDTAAKAWWVTRDPVNTQISWGHPSEHHILRLAGTAPPAIADPLNSALNDCSELTRARLKALPKQLTGWEPRMARALDLLEEALAVLERLIAPMVDLDVGDWVSFSPNRAKGVAMLAGTMRRPVSPDLYKEPVRSLGPGDYGRIVLYHDMRLVIDLGAHGVLDAFLFNPWVQRIAPPDERAELQSQPWHRRWLWFACHPEATGGRAICPCCGCPGIEAGRGTGCRLCGWLHDRGDFDPERPSAVHDQLTLALGRRRFKALGYAALPADESNRSIWRDPRVQVRRQCLVSALDNMASSTIGYDRFSLARIESLWGALQAMTDCAIPTDDGEDHE